MEPNMNQPGAAGQPGYQPQPANGRQPQEGQWPEHSLPVPEWQQGLGTNAIAGRPSVPEQPLSMPLPPAGTDAYTHPSTGPTYGTEPTYQQPAPPPLSPQRPQPHKKRWLPILLTILLLCALGTGVFFVVQNRRNNAKDTQGKDVKSSETTTAQLSTLGNINFGLPTDLSIFGGDTSTELGYHVYVTQDATNDKACSLEFGIATAEQLPGANLNDIVAKQLDAMKQAGATIDGPTSASELVLKDFSNPNTVYRLPTRTYAITKDGKQVRVYFSLALLKDGHRAVVSRQCLNANGTPDAAELARVEAAAKQISINKQ